VPWSTPISEYREIDGIRIGTHGDANWIETSGEWTYGKFDIRSITYNVDKWPARDGTRARQRSTHVIFQPPVPKARPEQSRDDVRTSAHQSPWEC
jgi:hypothetical protein